MDISFRVTGTEELERELERELSGLCQRATVATGKVVTAKAKRGNFKDHTRQLRSTISARNIGQRNGYWGVDVRAPKSYASFVNDGTEAHDIWPKAAHGAAVSSLKPGQTRRARGKGPHEHIVGRGIALRWKDSGGGEHFASMVHHPESKPYPFMDDALDVGRSYIRNFIQQGFTGIQTRLGNHG
jgi:hypothetical protein